MLRDRNVTKYGTAIETIYPTAADVLHNNLTFFNLPRPATTATTTATTTPQISETAHRTLGLACGFGTVGLQ